MAWPRGSGPVIFLEQSIESKPILPRHGESSIIHILTKPALQRVVPRDYESFSMNWLNQKEFEGSNDNGGWISIVTYILFFSHKHFFLVHTKINLLKIHGNCAQSPPHKQREREPTIFLPIMKMRMSTFDARWVAVFQALEKH